VTSASKPGTDLLVWVDIETTGLDPKTDAILEIACVITDGDLRDRSTAFSMITDAARDRAFSSMHPRVQDMHLASGLWGASLTSKYAPDDACAMLAEYISNRIPDGYRPPLAGSSVHFDRAFLGEHAPLALERLHYRNLDVSSVREAVLRFWPQVGEPREPAHRALADVRASIALLAYYRDALAPTARIPGRFGEDS
jgi:oligoribonuclease